MAEEEAWEEALDLDDSDLTHLRPLKRHQQPPDPLAASAAVGGDSISRSEPFLRRCSTTSSSTVVPQSSQTSEHSRLEPNSSPQLRLIPGPAGIVQASMKRRKDQLNDGQELVTTQEYEKRDLEGAVDEDFGRKPWLSAVEFIRRNGLDDDSGSIGVPLEEIKGLNTGDRAAQVVAVVKSCTSNGLGDLMVNLKDPKECVDASIHRRVLSEVESGKHISVGAVIIVKNVAVFSPSRSSHYLNITPSNVVKIFSKDYTAPLEEDNLALTNVHASLRSGCRDQTSTQQTQNRVSQAQTQDILNNLKRNSNSFERRGDHNTKMPLTDEGRPEVVTLKESGDNDRYGPNEIAIEIDDHSDKLEDDNESNTVFEEGSRSQCNNGAASGDLFSTQLNGRRLDTISQGNVSLPQWTDEQLDELFDMD